MLLAALHIPAVVYLAVLGLTNAATVPVFRDTVNYTAGCKANGGIIAIAIDSSGSICGESFAEIKHFTEYFVTNVLSSATVVNISVINYSNEADLVETFSKNSTPSYVSHMLSNLSHKGQGTNTHKALEFMKKNIFHNSSSSNTPQIAVIVTDGSSHNPQLTREYAETLKAMGVEIYAIGVGSDVNVEELEVISSYPNYEHVYLINDLNNVPLSMEALASLTNLVCTDKINEDVTLMFGAPLIGTIDVFQTSSVLVSSNSGPATDIEQLTHTVTVTSEYGSSHSASFGTSFPEFIYHSTSHLYFLSSMEQTDSIIQKVSVVQPGSVRFTNEPHIGSSVVSLSLSQFSQTLTIEHQSSDIEVMPTSHYSSSALVYPLHSESRSIEVIQSPWSRPEPSEISTEIRSSSSKLIMSSDVSVGKSIPYLSYTILSPTQAFYSSQDLHASSHAKASLAPTDEMLYQPSPSHTKDQIYQSSYTDRISISTIYLSSSQNVDLPVASTYTKVHTTDPQPMFASHNQTLSYSINTMLQSTPEFPTTKEINYTNMAVQSTSIVQIEFAMTTSALESSVISSSTAATSAASATEQPNTTVRTTKITSPTTTASCVAKIADVVFVIDSSGSIGAENFHKLKEFMKSIVRTFDIDSRYTRVAVIKYNDYPNIEFKLNNHTNLNELLAAIDGINYTIGGTNTADALQLMRSEGFDRERPAAPNIGIVITDGLSKYPTLTKAQAQLARNDGITLFAIGVGNETEQEELMNIASGDRVYHVEGFDALETINSAVAHTTCGVNLNESFVTRSMTSPRTTPSGCADYDDNCGSYGRDSCYDYEPFARGHCPKSCGFCRDENANTTKVCADATKDCALYGVEMCYKESQHDWVEKNCQKFCGFCGDKHAPLPTTPDTTIATTTEALCKDSIPNCHEYGGPGMCNTYGQWARQNCAKCPAWKLPEECSIEHRQGQCCPSPKCPQGFILTVHRR